MSKEKVEAMNEETRIQQAKRISDFIYSEFPDHDFVLTVVHEDGGKPETISDMDVHNILGLMVHTFKWIVARKSQIIDTSEHKRPT
jgi:catalase